MSTISLQQLNQQLEILQKTSDVTELLSSYAQSLDIAKSLNNVVLTSLSPAIDQINRLQSTVGGIVQQIAEPIVTVSQSIESIASSLSDIAPPNSKIAELTQSAAGFNQIANGFRITGASPPFEQLAQEQSLPSLVIGEVTSEIEKVSPQMKGTIVTELPDKSKELFAKITGDSDTMFQPAALKKIVTAINPRSIAQTLESQFGKTPAQIQSTLQEFAE